MSADLRPFELPPPSSRYELLAKIASGGMATVYLGRLRAGAGVWRLCALKRPLQDRLGDPDFRRMFVEEARLASRIHHPNVVAVLDVEEGSGDLLLVMDYVEGASLAELLTSHANDLRPLPARVAVRIGLDACAGLAAAHALTDPAGRTQHLVHRDISPQNILVGVDGMARITDFGIAKSVASKVSTTTGGMKGKLAYMAPEYIERREHDARSDVFALGVVLWEALTRSRLFRADNELDTLTRVTSMQAPPPSSVAPWLGGRIDGVFERALAKQPDERFQSAAAFAEALETAARKDDLVAKPTEVSAHVELVAAESLARRRQLVRERVLDDPATSVGRRPPEAADRPTVPEVRAAPRSVEPTTDDAAPASTGHDLERTGRSTPTHGRARALVVIAAATTLGVGAGALWFGRERAPTPPRTATSESPAASARALESAPAAKVEVAPAASVSPSPSMSAPAPRPPAPPRSASRPISPPPLTPAPAGSGGLPPNPYR